MASDPHSDTTDQQTARDSSAVTETQSSPDHSAAQTHLRATDILESITDGFHALDREWRFTYINAQAERIVSRTRAELLGKNIWEAFPESVGSTFEREYRRAVAEDTPVTFEEFYPPLSAWLEVRAFPSADGLSVYFRDITARRRAEETLHGSETRFRALADNIAQLAWMADASGWIFWYNRRWFDYTGTTLEEMQGWGWAKVHHPDHLGPVTERWREHLAAGQVWEDTFPLRGKDGTFRWFLSRAYPIRDEAGQVILWCGTNTDVTEQVAAQARLRQQSAAFETMWDALIVTDLAGRITECNGAFMRLSGYSREETLGQPISFLHLPEERAWVMPHIEEGMRRDGRWEGEVRFVRKDGSLGVSLTSVVPLRDEAGNMVGTVGANRDITEIKRTQEEIRRTQEENVRLLERDVAAAERQKGFLKDVLRSVSEGKLRLVDAPGELPAPLPQIGRAVRLDTTQKLRTFRQKAQRAAQTLGFADLRWQHLVTAASEAAMNAVVHAGGGLGRVCADGETVQVWVEDAGGGISYDILPRATLEKGWSSGSSLGHGFWLMLNTVDRVWLLTSEAGTTVVIEQQRAEPLPDWLGDLRI
ncbi:MAG: PAS domain S-box protein [Gemmatimonadaceae bacterium]